MGPWGRSLRRSEFDVWDIDEFRDALREKVYRDGRESRGLRPR